MTALCVPEFGVFGGDVDGGGRVVVAACDACESLRLSNAFFALDPRLSRLLAKGSVLCVHSIGTCPTTIVTYEGDRRCLDIVNFIGTYKFV